MPLLLTPPLFSRDVYSYVAQGKLMAGGFNPYLTGPSVMGGMGVARVAGSGAPHPALAARSSAASLSIGLGMSTTSGAVMNQTGRVDVIEARRCRVRDDVPLTFGRM